MSDSSNFGFAKLVPGFDFLQNLAKGASQSIPQMPHLSNWVAPTLSVEELEKRIAELKAVQFWLEQNGRALGATIQALEVQKMTLATLQGMNFSMGELANALRLKTTDAVASGARKVGEAAEAAASAVSGAADAVADAADKKAAGKKGEEKKPSGNGAAPVDPLQWWGALTQQFQQIAANAMKDAAQKTAVDTARNMAVGSAKDAMKAATGMAKAAAGMAKASSAASAPKTTAARKTPARKTPARKPRAKKTAT
ncbi:MAG TPA: PhaM family polyhydroxyalkanoate granule multifunctional regulatory protein [Ramlibacter sp.]|uniref:PhaM family polyhydroxyalkanoate granule multifunctional regulatory protein n=1 Tax=Ramlibacter sp. TaxID=1917967 RepID=UPI002D805472|nr:PhaM family polyhydroxyalkanoate granule multifunctional regulatory protein [Ramlibacter sp.]HET8748042.1 PhaM family polyhydroxyalkanoate granule multifunctional regulatory protein [Ramlibacter sp.]